MYGNYGYNNMNGGGFGYDDGSGYNNMSEYNGMNTGNFGYNGGGAYKPRKLTKAEILENVKYQAQVRYNCLPTNVVKIQETREYIRHSCPATGIVLLPMEIAQIESDYGIIEVPYYMCQICGKLYVAM